MIPQWNKEAQMWYFDSITFVLNKKIFNIIHTEILDGKDFLIETKDESNNKIKGKMSDLIKQYKKLKVLKDSDEIKLEEFKEFKVKAKENNQTKLF